VVFADIGDTITAKPADTLSLTVGGPEAGPLAQLGEDNLVLRAARALAAHYGVPAAAALTLDKRLPVASGIGGGSSDAAATLRALAVLWRIGRRRFEGRRLDDIEAIALGLGADVPACLVAQPVWVGGIGERLDFTARLPPLGIVLANPRRELPTAAVFRAREGGFSKEAERGDISRPETLFALLEQCRNDLTDAAIGLEPEVAKVLDRLGKLPGTRLVRMSGSGATCFALFADREAAALGAAALTEAEPGSWVRAGSLLTGLGTRPAANR